ASQEGYDFDFDPSGKGTSYSSEHDPSLKPGPYAAEYDYGPSDKSRAYIVDYPDYDYDPSAKATAYGIDYDPSKVTLDPGEMYTGGGKVDYSGTHDAKPDGGSGDGTTDWWGQKH
ncbi:MAG: hypothetical protein M3328_01340, partial [Chloroflexota bacterium]|nr:hypothetical protein [Chloroflexota bacterium]